VPLTGWHITDNGSQRHRKGGEKMRNISTIISKVLPPAILMPIVLIAFSLQYNHAWTGPFHKDKSQLAIVYDNNIWEQGLRSAWGFSCLVSLPEYCMLFDTGGDPSILLGNMDKMGVDTEDIESVVLSHIHGDHVGGLSGFLSHRKRPVTVYLPESFPHNTKGHIALMGADIKEVGGPSMIYPGVYTTGELGGSIKEQSLVLQTRKGLVVITGCAHPGIVEIVDYARSHFKENVYLLIGGFHLIGKSQNEIKEIAKQLDKLNIDRIAPCHCSGDKAREVFKDYYGEDYIECGTGLVLDIPDIRE
jgi:7,8-dihydropterin-6-yl-methyl-4-(beta-D-ribofuranosyl)aminobenzene 5'-phosphate synthase